MNSLRRGERFLLRDTGLERNLHTTESETCSGCYLVVGVGLRLLQPAKPVIHGLTLERHGAARIFGCRRIGSRQGGNGDE